MPTAQHASFAHPGRNAELFPIKSGDIVADFGAGLGHYVFEIAKLLQGTGRIYAIDVQQELLRRIKNEAHKKGIENIETIWGDIARPHGAKLPNNSVDLCLMSNVLFQLEQPKKALEEARRILKMDGKLIIIDWLESFRSLGPAKHHVFNKERCLEVAQEAGFAAVGQFAAGAHHYGFILHKQRPSR